MHRASSCVQPTHRLGSFTVPSGVDVRHFALGGGRKWTDDSSSHAGHVTMREVYDFCFSLFCQKIDVRLKSKGFNEGGGV